MKDEQLETMLTVRQVADFLQVSISTVRRWSDRGMLRFYRIGSRGDRRYRREDVLSFLQDSTGHPQTDITENDMLAHLRADKLSAPAGKARRGDNKPIRAK